MKRNLLVVMLLITTCTFAQTTPGKKKQDQKEKIKAGFGVTVAQVQPEFTGGPDSLLKFMNVNLRYPEQAMINRIQGKVYVGFLVEKTGKIKNVKILKGVNDDLDNEAMRLVQSMPDWKPGSTGGNPINVQYILPIDFYLPSRQRNQ